MTAPDLDALEKLADEATPGPWRHYSHGLPEFSSVQHLVESESPGVNEGDGLVCVTNAPNNRDAAFIAAANPPTIKALIAELKEARATIADVDSAARQAASMNDAGYTVTVERTATHIYAMTSAFLVRNGKGEGCEPRNAPRGLSDEC